MPDKKIHIEGIPQAVTLRKNARIKRLSIKISSRLGVVLCMPYGLSEARAIEFAIKQKEWICKHLTQEKYKSQAIPQTIQLANATISFAETEHNKITYNKENKTFCISVEESLSFEKKEKIKRILLEKVLRSTAKAFLPLRVEELARLHGFRYGKLSFRNQKTRWGSCSYKNDISLNIQLMRLPLHLIDYVIIHELAHTIHKNHSAKFWQLVHTKMGETLYLCKEQMRKQRIEL